MNKKIGAWIVGIIVLVIIILVIVSQNGSSMGAQNQPVKIGVIGPMTGGASVYGINLAKGAELARDDLKDTKHTYELVIEDDGGSAAQSASAAQKLINVDKVQALMTVTSGTGNAVKSIAAAAHIPEICQCSDTGVADGVYNFTDEIMPDDEAAAWLSYAASQKVKTIAIIYQNQPGFNLLINNVKEQAPAAGISVVYEEKDEPTVMDFNTSIAKARAAKPDLILIGFFPPQLDIIGKQLKDLGVKNVAGMATFSIAADPTLFNDLWYSDSALSDPAFADEFTKAFPDTRFNVRVAPYAYDSFNMLVQGFESGSSVSDYVAGLQTYAGKAGTLAQASQKGVFRSPVGIWEIENGAPVEVK